MSEIQTLKGGVSYGDSWIETNVSQPKSRSLSQIDIAQSHFFKVQITGLENKNMRHKVYDDFLPVSNVSFLQRGIVNMSLPLGIFADLPIAHKKKVTVINITMYDTDDDFYQRKLQEWYDNTTVDEDGYVGYIDDIVRELTLVSYNTKGKENFRERYSVLLADDMKIDRSTEANGFKMISFSVAIVGSA